MLKTLPPARNTVSIRLHHAFELNLASPTIENVQAWASPLRVRLQEMGEALQASWTVRTAVARCDRETWQGHPRPQRPLAHTYKEGRAKLEQVKQGHRDLDLDVTASVQLMWDAPTQRLYGLHFIEHPALIQAFYEQPEVVPAPYYDHDDSLPDGMTFESWGIRRQLWARLLPDGIPAHAGVSVTLVGDRQLYRYPAIDMIEEHWPTIEQRVRTLRNEVIMEEMALGLQAGGETLTFGRLVELLDLGLTDEPFRADVERRLRETLETSLRPEDLVE